MCGRGQPAGRALQIEQLEHTIAKLRHERFGQSSEHSAVLAQLELQLSELQADASQAEAEAEVAAERAQVAVRSLARARPARRPLPEHLSRERVVYPVPEACPCCGGRLHALGEDVTETLELVPRQWKVIQHVRPKYSCRSCEAITQPPAPSHPIARGRAGAAGACAVRQVRPAPAADPPERDLCPRGCAAGRVDPGRLGGRHRGDAAAADRAVGQHVLAAQRIHADETTVPVLAKGRTRTGRLWTYVRDDRPFGGANPPTAVYFYSPDRGGKHPEAHLAGYAGLMQADAYAGFNQLYEATRRPGPIVEAMCWVHARRKFFDLARLNKAPIALEAVARIDALFAIEREINGQPPDERQRVRQQRSLPLVKDLEAWLRQQRARLSAANHVAKAIAYSLNRWDGLIRFLDDGRLCMSNNAAEQALRGIAVGRNNWTFAGSDDGGRRAAAIYTLIETAKLNDIDPRAWLADVLARLQDHPAKRIDELLPWNWKRLRGKARALA